MEKNFAELLEESLKKISRGNKVVGEIIKIFPKEVYVDIGRKQLGIIPFSELTLNPDEKPEDIVKIGEKIDLVITDIDDNRGIIRLSKIKANFFRDWNEIFKALEEKEILTGVIKKILSGGVLAKYKTFNVFIPVSLLEKEKKILTDELIGESVQFIIIEADKIQKKIIGSSKQIADDNKKVVLEKFWNSIEIGQKLLGKIDSITKYGVFVNLGPINGLIHISDFSKKKVCDLNDYVKIGQEIEVQIKSFDAATNKIALTCSEFINQFWEKVKTEFPVGKVFETTVKNITKFGAFVGITKNIDGMIHISQICDKKIDSISEVLAPGNKVRVKVIELNDQKMKINLTMNGV
jgi:4-hydroxy-3-methylbut-2-enyl diphosphate reductase